MINTTKAARPRLAVGDFARCTAGELSSCPGPLPADRDERMHLLLLPARYHGSEARGAVELDRRPAVRERQAALRATPMAGERQSSADGRSPVWAAGGATTSRCPPDANWPTGEKVEYYGHNYPIEDCRSGICRPGYLMWNGYIPAHQINSYDKNGKPNGIMGVPANYKPATRRSSRIRRTTPAAARPLTRTTATRHQRHQARPPEPERRLRWEPGSPVDQPAGTQHQPVELRRLDVQELLINERFKLRVQADFFNVTNTPGNSRTAGQMVSRTTWQHANGARNCSFRRASRSKRSSQ